MVRVYRVEGVGDVSFDEPSALVRIAEADGGGNEGVWLEDPVVVDGNGLICWYEFQCDEVDLVNVVVRDCGDCCVR